MTQATQERLQQFERDAETAHRLAMEQIRADWARMSVRNRQMYRITYCEKFEVAFGSR